MGQRIGIGVCGKLWSIRTALLRKVLYDKLTMLKAFVFLLNNLPLRMVLYFCLVNGGARDLSDEDVGGV